jgi:hypothetical protein
MGRKPWLRFPVPKIFSIRARTRPAFAYALLAVGAVYVLTRPGKPDIG